MKVIITEEQLDKMKSKLMGLVNKEGFDEAARILGLSKLKLFKLVDFGINDLGIDNMFPIIVEENNVYKGCEITVDYFEDGYGVYWVYEEDIDGGKLFVVSMAKPEFDKGKVYVENSHSFVEGGIVGFGDNNFEEANNGIEYNVKTISYSIPTDFGSIDEMMNWYNTEYLPKTYEIIKGQAKEIIKEI
jgi:hypothetical protein